MGWKRTKKSMRQQSDAYWNAVYDLRPFYRSLYWVCVANPAYPHYNPFPKLKKRQFHVSEYSPYSSCPKQWNKIYHIRPVRRQWKRFCHTVSVLFEEDNLHISEGMPYPSDRRHIYYW